MKSLDSRAYLLEWLPPVFMLGMVFAIFATVFGVAYAVGNFNMVRVFIALALIGIMLLVAFVGGYFYSRAWARNYKYDLTDNGFVSESGVFEINHLTIPYDRIISVDIKRGILARMLGLADLYLMTAGVVITSTGKGSATRPVWGRVPGISFEDAKAFRDDVLRRVKMSKH